MTLDLQRHMSWSLSMFNELRWHWIYNVICPGLYLCSMSQGDTGFTSSYVLVFIYVLWVKVTLNLQRHMSWSFSMFSELRWHWIYNVICPGLYLCSMSQGDTGFTTSYVLVFIYVQWVKVTLDLQRYMSWSLPMFSELRWHWIYNVICPGLYLCSMS